MVLSAAHFAGFSVVDGGTCFVFDFTFLGVGFAGAGFSGAGVVGSILVSGIAAAGAAGGAGGGATLQSTKM